MRRLILTAAIIFKRSEKVHQSGKTKTSTKTTAWVAGAALALILGGAPMSRAQTQTFTFSSDLSGARVVTLTQDGGKTSFQGYAGRYKGQLGSAPVNVFCVDIGHEIHVGDSYAADTQYDITSRAGALNGGYYGGGLASALTSGDIASLTLTQANGRASEVAYLADNYLNAASFSGASGSTDTGANLTGLGLSVWDILQDGGDGLAAGRVQTGASDAGAYGGLVSYYEALASAHAGDASQTAAWAQAPLDAAGRHLQDYVYERPVAAPAAVPEPGIVTFLSSLGLVAGGFGLRRRRQAVRG